MALAAARITIEASPTGVDRIVVITAPGQRPAGLRLLERWLTVLRTLDVPEVPRASHAPPESVSG